MENLDTTTDKGPENHQDVEVFGQRPLPLGSPSNAVAGGERRFLPVSRSADTARLEASAKELSRDETPG